MSYDNKATVEVTGSQWADLLDVLKEWHPESEIFAPLFRVPFMLFDDVRITIEVLEVEK